MVGEPSHVKQLSLIHVCKIGLNSCVPVRAIYSATATASIIFSVLRIRDVYPGSRILVFNQPGSRISDPGSKNRNKREGWKKIRCHTFFCSHTFHKIENYFIFGILKKKILIRGIYIRDKNILVALKTRKSSWTWRKKPLCKLVRGGWGGEGC